MPSVLKTWRPALLALGGYWAVLIYQLGAQWSAYEQYNYGWAVPFLCAYLLWERFTNPSFISHPPSSIPRNGGGFLLSATFCLLAATWAVTRWLHEANPIWRMSSWVLALIAVTLTLLVLRLTLGKGRWWHYAFPVCFFLVAVPWPSPIENRLTETLTSGNMAVTTELLAALGIPALQKGNVIEIATGLVGVDEACSGIRSFQSTLMIALFFGELYRLPLGRRLLAVAAGFLFAFLFNIGRTLLLVYVAAHDGIPAMHKWHDPAGVAILVGCFTSLWWFCGWLRVKQAESGIQNPESRNSPVAPKSVEGGSSSLLSTISSQLPLRLAFGLGLWFVLTEIGVEAWYRLHEVRAAAAQAWTVRWPEGELRYKPVEISAAIRKQLAFDSGAQCSWQPADGSYWQLVYFRWLPSRSLYARVRSHQNKTHRPEHCLSASGMKLLVDEGLVTYPVGAVKFGLHKYLFEAEGRRLYVYYGQYEDSSAPDAVASYRKGVAARVAAARGGSRNYGLRIFELAVTGYPDAAQTDAAVQRRLPQLIRFGADAGD